MSCNKKSYWAWPISLAKIRPDSDKTLIEIAQLPSRRNRGVRTFQTMLSRAIRTAGNTLSILGESNTRETTVSGETVGKREIRERDAASIIEEIWNKCKSAVEITRRRGIYRSLISLPLSDELLLYF